MGDNNSNKLFLIPAVAAATAVVGLTVAQSDQFSRRFLKSGKLQAKRLQEYKYRWDQANEKALLRARMYVAGGVDAHQQNLAASTKSQMKGSGSIWDEGGLKSLIQEWMQQDKQRHNNNNYKQRQQNGGAASIKSSTSSRTPFPQILGLVREGEDGSDSKEILVELYHPQSGRYQLPLQRFGLLLADILESTVMTTALCFVADASSGLASQFVADLLEASKAGVAIIREPIWMTSFAAMVGERIIRKEKMQRILFGFCRMEAMRVRDQVGDARTVLFTIPGQATTPILLPLLQAAFPEDRHVFGYQSCLESVERAMALRSCYKRATVPTRLEEAISYNNSSGSVVSDPTRLTTPMKSGLTKSVYGLAEALAALRLYHADTVEAWMASVDTFFKLKDEETTNGYLPYTLKLALLIGDPNGSLEEDSNRFYSLSSLMQFVTGCRSRPLPAGVLDAAKEWLRDFSHQHHATQTKTTKLTQPERKAVENCAFKHKSILIQDKTLKDTVLPSKHWTLKQAAKRGCACCAPEEDEDEDEEDATTQRRGNATTFGSSRDNYESTTSNGNGNYVDGKTTFAFDPTKFSAPTPAPAPAPSRPKYVDGKTTFAFDPTKFS